MTDVFISYSKQDRAIAQALADRLTRLDVSVWWDFELYAGDDFSDAILKAIDEAKAVVVIWSATAAKSPWVRDEATRAMRQKKLVTTLAPNATLKDVPLGFGQYQSVPVGEIGKVVRALMRLGVTPAVVPADPVTPTSPSTAPKTDLQQDILGHLEFLASFMPKQINEIDDITNYIFAAFEGTREHRIRNKNAAIVDLHALSRTPGMKPDCEVEISTLIDAINKIEVPPPLAANKPIIKRRIPSTKPILPDTDFRDLVDIGALGDAIDDNAAEAVLLRYQAGTLTQEPSDVHRHLKDVFDELRTRYRDKNFKKALDTYLNNFERDFAHRNHEGHRLSDYLRSARQGKAYLFLVHVARRRSDFSQR